MTALAQYQRLECSGLWRETPEAQKREVFVSFGDASVVISDSRSDRALAHWSLPALVRVNPGKRPAIFAPGLEPGEELELDDDTMIEAIEQVQSTIDASRPKPGRLRIVILGSIVAATLALGIFWMPGALITHAAAVAPPSKRAEIGAAILSDLSTLTGPPCTGHDGQIALKKMSARLLGAGSIVVVPSTLEGALRLPGQIVVVGRSLLEQHDSPDVIAGYVLAAHASAGVQDPLLPVLRHAGIFVAFQLLTTGDLPQGALHDYGRALLGKPQPPASDADLLRAFGGAKVSSTPYARALDPLGQRTRGLIAGDPMPDAGAEAVLDDGEWVALLGICES